MLLPPALARTVDRELRAVHRSLAPRRDLDATLESLHRLRDAARHAHRDRSLHAIDRLASAVRGELGATGPAIDLHAACLGLARVADALQQNPVDGDFARLAQAVAATARRSRKAMRRALASGDPADYHRWRKWMKYHTFHLRYLVPLWPELLRVQATTAEHCAAWLGESQDLELVRAALARHALDPEAQRAIAALVNREQHRLLHQAASAGLHLHAESPRALARRLAGYEEARLHRPPAP